MLDSQNSTVDEMLDNLSDEQEELLLASLKASYTHVCSQEGGDRARTAFVEALANDENTLKRLSEILQKYKSRAAGRD